MALTRYAQKLLQDHELGKAALPLQTMYLALFSVDPTEDGLTTGEPSGNGYARLLLTPSLSFTTLATGAATNTALMQFNVATAAWGADPLGYFGTMDAITGGNMWRYGPLSTAFLVVAGDAPSFSEGSLVFTID